MYTAEALDRRVQGLFVTKCRVPVSGRVDNCRVLKPLPMMDSAILYVFEHRRYEPAVIGGSADGNPLRVQTDVAIAPVDERQYARTIDFSIAVTTASRTQPTLFGSTHAPSPVLAAGGAAFVMGGHEVYGPHTYATTLAGRIVPRYLTCAGALAGRH